MQKEPRWEFYRAQLHRLRQVSAIFALSDYYAIDLMHFLTAHGFSVPGDVSIAGFDDTPMCEMVHPALTTVRQDGALRAKIAVETLRELRKGTHIDREIPALRRGHRAGGRGQGQEEFPRRGVGLDGN